MVNIWFKKKKEKKHNNFFKSHSLLTTEWKNVSIKKKKTIIIYRLLQTHFIYCYYIQHWNTSWLWILAVYVFAEFWQYCRLYCCFTIHQTFLTSIIASCLSSSGWQTQFKRITAINRTRVCASVLDMYQNLRNVEKCDENNYFNALFSLCVIINPYCLKLPILVWILQSYNRSLHVYSVNVYEALPILLNLTASFIIRAEINTRTHTRTQS